VPSEPGLINATPLRPARMTHLSPTTNPTAARVEDDDDHTIVVPPEDRCLVVPPRTPDDLVVALPGGGRLWLPPLARALTPDSLRTPAEAARKEPPPPPDGLRTPREAARKLGCSIKTLLGHIASGALRYVNLGHGTKRPRRMFTDADLDEFVANQTRKDIPCPSTSPRARHTGTSTSSGEVIGFTARRNARRAARPKK
jgi:hypothetical protein